jgi:hypothetical protein
VAVLSPINRSQCQGDHRIHLPATAPGGNGPLEINPGGNGPLEINPGGNGPLEIDGGSRPLEIPGADEVVKAFNPIALERTSSTNTTTINHQLMDPSE